MESRHYWRLRSARQDTASRIATARIVALSRATDTASLIQTGGRALARSLILILPPLLVLCLTQSIVLLNTQRRDWPEWLESMSPRTVRWLDWITAPVAETFDAAALPTAAIEVAGVFVAVYFATVTFVVSTTYRDATPKLRNQIVRQPESRWYAAFFTQAVVYVALALGLPVIDREATHLTLMLAGLSAALVVLSFGRIWVTLFVSLEPTSLFPAIGRDLNRWIRRADELGTEKRPSPAAARRANQMIRDKLDTVEDLITLILDREHERSGDRGIGASSDPRISLALMHLLTMWESYSRRKHTITTLPGWSPTRTQAKDWFLSSQSEVSVAVATGTTLSASEVVDDHWYERRISHSIERLLRGRDLGSTGVALRGMRPLSRTLGARGQFEELRLWLAAITFPPMVSVAQYAKDRGPGTRSASAPAPTPAQLLSGVSAGRRTPLSRAEHFALPEEASAHNLVDLVLMEALSACLGYVDYFERMGHLLPGVASTITDGTEHTVAGRLVVSTMSDLRVALELEVRIEGARVTPDNAVTQFVARALATESIDEVAHHLSYLETELWPWVIEIGASDTWAAGAALSRATELTEKLATLLDFARRLLEVCESVHIETDDRWPDTGLSDVEERIRSLKDQLELPVARLATAVDAAPDSDRPDHFGWAYYRAHENILRRVLSREAGPASELRHKVALMYAVGDVATQRLVGTVRRHHPGVINSYVAEPYLRFLQLSGIALIISEVTNDAELFRPFESLWLGLLGDPQRATQILARAAATLSSETGVFALTPGGVERSSIEIRANDTLDELNVPRDLFDLGGFGLYEDDDDTTSLSTTATRLLGSLSSSHYEGAFYAHWLRPHAISVGAVAPKELEKYLSLLELEDLKDTDDLDDRVDADSPDALNVREGVEGPEGAGEAEGPGEEDNADD